MWQDPGAVGFFFGGPITAIPLDQGNGWHLRVWYGGVDGGIVVRAAGRMDGTKGDEAIAVAKVFVPQFKR